MKTSTKTGIIAERNKQTNIQVGTDRPKTIGDLVKLRMDDFSKVLPSILPPDQFCRLTLNALNNTPHLAECTQASFFAAAMNCAQLGLKPNINGEGYLLPYKNNKLNRYECQFIPGYKGLMQLARRSGEIASIDAQTVYNNDTFDISYGFEPALIHKPALGDRGNVIGFYAAVILKDGGKNAFWMSVDDAMKYGKKYSKTFTNGPWQTDFEAMAKKSCLRQVLKMCPCSTDVQQALDVENQYDRNGDERYFFDGLNEVEEGGVTENTSEIEQNDGSVEEEAEFPFKVNSDGEIVG